MPRHLPAALLCGLALGCGASLPVASPPAEGLPLTFPPPPVIVPTALGPEPRPPPRGAPSGACPLQWTPRAMGASVIHIPPELGARMMAPLVRALCVCTQPGQSLMVVALLVPGRGEVTAHTVERSEVRARASVSIDACLAMELGAGRYEAFPLGGDNLCPEPQVTHGNQPGEPAPIWAPRRAGCSRAEDVFASITYPLRVDRRDEVPR